MIVTRTGEWTVLRIVPSDFDLVGDVSARFCPSQVAAPDDECNPQILSSDCVCEQPDCPPDLPIRTF
jgi:hypothetical protein